MALYIGIDFGTSGCRACAIDGRAAIQAMEVVALPDTKDDGDRHEQDPELWWQALTAALDKLCAKIDASRVRAIAVDGTSGTLLLADGDGRPLTPALMYNDARARAEAARIARHAPARTAAHGATSSLAKLLYLLAKPAAKKACYALHQADWLSGRLRGAFGIADEHNCAKLGFDVERGVWPAWLAALNVPISLLPKVLAAGTPLGRVDTAISRRYGMDAHTLCIAGTTDSTAGVLAAGAQVPGEAVTALGTTLVMKVISRQPLFVPQLGIYSHRLGSYWLTGGGSNSGGAVLRQFFTPPQIQALSARIDPTRTTGFDYYPLPGTGERFPVNDPDLASRIAPRAADDAVFLHALFEGMAGIERLAYDTLAAQGAPYPTSVRSVGGGARNVAWTAIRARCLGIPLLAPQHTQAAYGSALLARRACAAPAI